MLSTPHLVKYSEFYINNFSDPDTEEYGLNREYYESHNYFADDTLINKKVGIYGQMNELDLNPIYHCNNQQFNPIIAKNLATYLNRNRYLSNKKHPDNDNYREIFYKKGDGDMAIETYGTCDTPEQIYNRLNFLNKIKDREFFIAVGYVHKEILKDGKSSYGGYRQHKNGGYYGTKHLKCEYLADEDEIENGIFSFKILELKKSDHIVIKQENFTFCKSKYGTHHTIFDNKDDSYLISHMYVEDGEIVIGSVSNYVLRYPYDAETFDYEKIDSDLKKLVDGV